MTKNFLTVLFGGALIALTACGDDEPNGWCDTADAEDPDCLLDGACAASTCIEAGTCEEADAAACYAGGVADSDACRVGADGDIQLDPNDPDCEECDFDSSIDGCIVCPDPTDTTDDTCCDLANAPGWCDPFVPETFQTQATVAYDPATNTGRGWQVQGMAGPEAAPARAIFLVFAPQFESTNNPEYACSSQISLNDGATLTTERGGYTLTAQSDFDGNTQEVTYEHFNFTFSSGSFTTSDFEGFAIGGAPIAGCSTKFYDPAVAPDGLAPAIDANNWTFAVGTMTPLNDVNFGNPDHPDNAAYTAGNFVGASFSNPDLEGANLPFYHAESYALDENFALVETGDTNDPLVRLPQSDVLVGDERDAPERGLFDILYSFNGQPILSAADWILGGS